MHAPTLAAATLDWLLDASEPAVRAQTLTDLIGRAPDDEDVLTARRDIAGRGMAARVLDGIDLDAKDLYRPKYGAPYHCLIALAEMGVTAHEPRAAALLERCLAFFLGDGTAPRDPEVCVVGNTARAAIRMGRGDDARVHEALRWLVATQLDDGGWNCWPDRDPHGSLDGWEALGAFAALPAERRPHEVVRRGVEFFLSRNLGVDDPYEAWHRVHFPAHYYYDILTGLDIVTQLGDPLDSRLEPALAWLSSKRDADGRWRLDAQHPDLSEGAGYTLRDLGNVRPFEVEPLGAPSRWATLRAARVLQRRERKWE